MCTAKKPLHHSYAALTAVLVIAGIVSAAVVAIILLRRHHRLPVLKNFTFNNPLFFGNEQSRSDNTHMVEEKADEESWTKWRTTKRQISI